MNADLKELIALSHRYGTDSAFVLAGGGNTSMKQGDRLWVKASGHPLATIDAAGFVELDRTKLDAMLNGTWPGDPKAREAAFIETVMAARVHPELGQRPSVEALLHHLLPSRFVVHTHPGVINALTCCVDGKALTLELFGDRVLWQPYVDPGLTLAQHLQASLDARRPHAVAEPAAIFLANHGLIVGGESTNAIERETHHLVSIIQARLELNGLLVMTEPTPEDNARLQRYADALAAARQGLSPVIDDSEMAVTLASTPAYRDAALAGPLSPDQIVYCRSAPLYLESSDRDFATQWNEAWDAYEKQFGFEPWIAIVAGAGVIAFRSAVALSDISRAVFMDAASVYAKATHLGGVCVLSNNQRRFIEDWEVEAYRRAVMNKAAR